MNRILVTGAKGQIGSDLVVALRNRYGADRIVESDIVPPAGATNGISLYRQIDVRDAKLLEETVDHFGIDTIYHLASLLSATGEHNPDAAWDVNVNGTKNILDLAARKGLKVFWPSSIAVFGPGSPHQNAPQTTILDPTTMYGITKVSGEFLCRYYAGRFGVDVRSVRYPGVISYTAPPGGGTTDYAVEIFYAALEKGSYTCFVRPDTRLPMMYMPDAIRATIELMEADPDRLTVRTSYNLAAFSFSAEELAAEITKHLPGFTCHYSPDFHQEIADSWPQVIDDSQARKDWHWQPEYTLSSMVEDMLEKLSQKLALAGNGQSLARSSHSNRP
jgi:nucleoside-diphosphate-sugar epimerase